MEDNTILLEHLEQWIATRPDEVVLDAKKGFYSFDIVMDAFNKGKETGESNFKQYLRDLYYQKFKLATNAIIKFLETLWQKKYSPKKIFLNHSLNQSIILISISPETHANNDFIEYAYGEALNLQVELAKENIIISINFVSEGKDTLNLNLIKSDGFDFSFDFENVKEYK